MTAAEVTHPGAAFIAKLFGPTTRNPVFICSLPNSRNGGTGERPLTTRNMDHVAGFATKMDQPGRAFYFCVSTLKPNRHRRAKENISELTCLFADIDFKGVIETPEEIRRIIGNLMLPPSMVNFTGHGLHLFWFFKTSAKAAVKAVNFIEARLRSLADHIGGDPAVCEVSRLMRLPGTHNSKEDGEWIEVVTEVDSGRRYHFRELTKWLEDVADKKVIHRKSAEKKTGNGHDDNPFSAYANGYSGKPPIDIEARLAAMTYQDAGDAGIHATQISVTAAMLNRGDPIDEVVSAVLAATQAAARNLNWNWKREERAIRKMCETWQAKHPEQNKPNGDTNQKKQEQAPPLLQPYVWRPFSEIPRRQWLHAGHYIREQVVMTVAPGGFGKTSLILCNVLEMVTGRGLIGPAPAADDLRVAYWNAEDPDDEIERRVAAACLRHNIDPAGLCDRLSLGSRLTGKRRIASINRHGNVEFDAAMLADIDRLIRDLRLDVVIFDPLIAFHRVPEGDNTLMEQVIKDGFGELAARTTCCIELSQHTRKPSQGRTGDLTADDSRGAGAIANAARSVRVLNRMTIEEAELPKIADEERRHYLRVSRDKTNMAPPGNATWVHLVNVELPNGDAGRPGDQVQAAETWDYPQPMDDVTADDMRWIRNAVRGQDYRADSRSPDWVGRPLASRLGLDPDEKGDRKKLNAILKVWFANGVLAVDNTRKDEKRRPRPFVIPGNWNETAE
jgi:hypothetical protein